MNLVITFVLLAFFSSILLEYILLHDKQKRMINYSSNLPIFQRFLVLVYYAFFGQLFRAVCTVMFFIMFALFYRLAQAIIEMRNA